MKLQSLVAPRRNRIATLAACALLTGGVAVANANDYYTPPPATPTVPATPAPAPPAPVTAPAPAPAAPASGAKAVTFSTPLEAKSFVATKAASGDKWLVVGSTAVDVPKSLEKLKGLRTSVHTTRSAATSKAKALRAQGRVAKVVATDSGFVVIHGKKAKKRK